MDQQTIEKKIRLAEEQISKDKTEIQRINGQIRRSQERKRFLEGRIRENSQDLSNLNNRKAMMAIEGSIGKVDDAKLALLMKILEEHGDEIGKEDDERQEAGIKTE